MHGWFWLKAFLINVLFLLFYHWQQNPKLTDNEKLPSFKIHVRLCSSFSQLKQPINWIIRAHIKPLTYFLSIKALWTTTVWKFQPSPSLPPPLRYLSENSSSVNIQFLLDSAELCFQRIMILKVPASTFYKPSPARLPHVMHSARVEPYPYPG